MELILSPIEARVLGSLIEKEITTPEYYPMSLNALVNACNQKSNRDPVMELKEEDVLEALDSLRSKRLVWQRSVTGARVSKYEHNILSVFNFNNQEVATICILLLRGPQTAGEIRGRTDRMYQFQSLEEVEAVLQSLIKREDGPLVAELPRRPGHKENRYMHLLCGAPVVNETEEQPEIRTAYQSPVNERISALENEVKRLNDELTNLKFSFEDFRKQFG